MTNLECTFMIKILNYMRFQYKNYRNRNTYSSITKILLFIKY